MGLLPLNQELLYVHVPTPSASTPLIFTSEKATCDCYEYLDIRLETPVDGTLYIDYYGTPYLPSSVTPVTDPVYVVAIPISGSPVSGWSRRLPSAVAYRERVRLVLDSSPAGVVPLSISVILRRSH